MEVEVEVEAQLNCPSPKLKPKSKSHAQAPRPPQKKTTEPLTFGPRCAVVPVQPERNFPRLAVDSVQQRLKIPCVAVILVQHERSTNVLKWSYCRTEERTHIVPQQDFGCQSHRSALLTPVHPKDPISVRGLLAPDLKGGGGRLRILFPYQMTQNPM